MIPAVSFVLLCLFAGPGRHIDRLVPKVVGRLFRGSFHTDALPGVKPHPGGGEAGAGWGRGARVGGDIHAPVGRTAGGMTCGSGAQLVGGPGGPFLILDLLLFALWQRITSRQPYGTRV